MDTKLPAQQGYYYFVYFLHFSICVGGEVRENVIM